ncbi:Acylphosphatase protein [Salinisphaera shabanensis E1L3A]|uniref:Acylphosphatase n=1 Tax=Salinisphaera shabanensis E1L3A TaxID=1033802 RepID=U2ERA1_9GAMM|nr:acylphosphatase [Salinisphaera shabanensis]ERJ20532.1 Acylphosphatase protein [Salinisphaera shabanensis E1L3A]
MKNTRQFLVSGRVQGVGFRDATRTRANELGLAGWVRNLSDGRVEVQAAGSGEKLNALADWLQDGPPSAKVEHVDTQYIESSDTAPEPFAVR